MNATICKILRKAARNASVGMPVRKLLVKEIKKYKEDTEHPGTKVLVKRSKVAINSPLSFRGIYRHLKGVYNG